MFISVLMINHYNEENAKKYHILPLRFVEIRMFDATLKRWKYEKQTIADGNFSSTYQSPKQRQLFNQWFFLNLTGVKCEILKKKFFSNQFVIAKFWLD